MLYSLFDIELPLVPYRPHPIVIIIGSIVVAFVLYQFSTASFKKSKEKMKKKLKKGRDKG